MEGWLQIPGTFLPLDNAEIGAYNFNPDSTKQVKHITKIIKTGDNHKASLDKAVKLVVADANVFIGGGDRWWSIPAADVDDDDGNGGLGVRIDADLGMRKLGLFLAKADVKKPLKSEDILFQAFFDTQMKRI